MSHSDPLVSRVNIALENPDVRASIRAMHAQGYSLVKMVEDLGFDDGMTASIRKILQNLPAGVIDGIRQATLEMLDRGENRMPLDCDIPSGSPELGQQVTVEVTQVRGKR
jgi:hypothetical protein